ncbi:MAG TPA: FHA domain-containing protein [Polyangia bacterium]|nr:FHA domain-containing protein [Polyangia bacterium]
MIKLTMTEKGGEPKALSFDKEEVTIGRVSGNDIVLPKGNVSKRHSRLLVRDGHVEIADLKSTNGTYVNGKKITEVTPLGATDRVYVGDFLIVIESLSGDVMSPSRRMPPPPPPPRSSSSSAANLPVDDETGSAADDGDRQDEDEADLPLAAKPPRAGRLPPPPPPPPRRPPTPLASPALGDESVADDLPAPSAAEVSAADNPVLEESTNNMGLFERRKTADHATFEGGGRQRLPTGSVPASAAEQGPLPAPPGQAMAPAPDFAAVAGGGAGEGLEGLLADPAVAQIVIAGPDAAFVDRGSGLAPYGGALGDANAVADTMWRLANMAVPPPAPDNPIVDVRFSDGTRLAAIFPPVSPLGVVGSIRRPVPGERALADLVPPGAKDVQTLLEAAVAGQRNLLLTGDAAAIVVLTGALGALIPAERRVISIGVGAARARAGWTDLQPTSDLGALVRVAASFRADHLLLAEAVGLEVADLLLAAARGQEGILVAVPARTVAEGLARLEALATPALGGGAASVAPLVSSTIDLVVHVVANADGGARIVDVGEPRTEAGRVAVESAITWRSDSGRRGGGAGKLQVTGVSARLGAALAAVGQSLPSSLVRR